MPIHFRKDPYGEEIVLLPVDNPAEFSLLLGVNEIYLQLIPKPSPEQENNQYGVHFELF